MLLLTRIGAAATVAAPPEDDDMVDVVAIGITSPFMPSDDVDGAISGRLKALNSIVTRSSERRSALSALPVSIEAFREAGKWIFSLRKLVHFPEVGEEGFSKEGWMACF